MGGDDVVTIETAFEAALGLALDALHLYGRHLDDCALVAARDDDECRCTCGLTELLRTKL